MRCIWTPPLYYCSLLHWSDLQLWGRLTSFTQDRTPVTVNSVSEVIPISIQVKVGQLFSSHPLRNKKVTELNDWSGWNDPVSFGWLKKDVFNPITLSNSKNCIIIFFNFSYVQWVNILFTCSYILSSLRHKNDVLLPVKKTHHGGAEKLSLFFKVDECNPTDIMIMPGEDLPLAPWLAPPPWRLGSLWR